MSRIADLEAELADREKTRAEIGLLLDATPVEAPAWERYAQAHDQLSDEIGGLRRELFDLEGDAAMREAASDRAFAQWTTR